VPKVLVSVLFFEANDVCHDGNTLFDTEEINFLVVGKNISSNTWLWTAGPLQREPSVLTMASTDLPRPR